MVYLFVRMEHIYIYIYLLPRYVVSMEFSAADSGVVDC